RPVAGGGRGTALAQPPLPGPRRGADAVADAVDRKARIGGVCGELLGDTVVAQAWPRPGRIRPARDGCTARSRPPGPRAPCPVRRCAGRPRGAAGGPVTVSMP